MEFCKNCLMNSSINEFKIIKNSECNFCFEWEKNKDKYINLTKDKINLNLDKIKNLIKEKSKKSKYDCVVGLSGGTDSSFVVYYCTCLKLLFLYFNLALGLPVW